MTPADCLGFGCVGLTTLPTARHALRLLHQVHELGLTHFDTAPTYGQGYSERLLGLFLREQRGPVTVTTKFGLGHRLARALPPQFALPLNFLRRGGRRPGPVAPAVAAALLAPRRIGRPEVEAAFAQSRRLLGRDRIDCYLLHEGLPAFLEDDARDFLFAQKTAGHIGALGVAAGGRNYVALEPAALAGWDVLQYEYGPAWPETRALPGRFPSQRHFFHSCLRGLAPADEPARILAECVRANPRGRVLFSSTNPAHLRANVRAVAAA